MWPRRTSEAPHHLYLVRYGRVQKFGHGTEGRVRRHLGSGCEVVQVIRVGKDAAVAAERALKRRYRRRLRRGRQRGLATSFGAGTEVLPASVSVDLRTVIDGADVTRTFRKRPVARRPVWSIGSGWP